MAPLPISLYIDPLEMLRVLAASEIVYAIGVSVSVNRFIGFRYVLIFAKPDPTGSKRFGFPCIEQSQVQNGDVLFKTINPFQKWHLSQFATVHGCQQPFLAYTVTSDK